MSDPSEKAVDELTLEAELEDGPKAAAEPPIAEPEAELTEDDDLEDEADDSDAEPAALA
jgi:hypothetical protein